MPSRKQLIESRFRKLFGLPCWQVERGQGSFVTMEFGEPRLTVREPITPRRKVSAKVREGLMRRFVRPRGEWYFWVYCADWRFKMKGKLVGDSSSKRAIERAVRAMDGQKLIGFHLYPTQRKTVLRFDLGGVLEIGPYPRGSDFYDPENELWHLYEPAGKVLTYRSDNMIAYADGNVSESEATWRKVS